MYYKAIETNAQLKNTINEAMKKDAARRMRELRGHKVVRAECAQNRKALTRLTSRIKAYENTVATSKNSSGYNKPGSLQF